MLFNKYLNSLNKFQTFQLYIIIAIAILFPYFYFIDLNSDKKIYSNKNFIHLSGNIKELKQKIIVEDNIKILKELEKEAIKYKSLNIQSFSINKSSIYLNGISNQEDFFRFLIFCENYSVTSRLTSLSLKPLKKDNLFNFSLTIKFKKKYLSLISTQEKQSLEKRILFLNDKKEKQQINLQAIFNKQAIINDKVFQQGDKFDKYIIKKISKDHVILSNNQEIKKLSIKELKNDL